MSKARRAREEERRQRAEARRAEEERQKQEALLQESYDKALMAQASAHYYGLQYTLQALEYRASQGFSPIFTTPLPSAFRAPSTKYPSLAIQIVSSVSTVAQVVAYFACIDGWLVLHSCLARVSFLLLMFCWCFISRTLRMYSTYP